MRIVVTGRQGQVARALASRGAAKGYDIELVGRPALDLAGGAEAIAAALEASSPDVIVSAAAYTAVDRAESEPELAFQVNEEGTRAIAAAAAKLAVPLIHLSTDYVFNGAKTAPYVECDPTGPTGVYGASKLAGEGAVLAEHVDSAILRTAWVYSPFGHNFVKTMFGLARGQEEVSVVADQRGNPTSALDIADAVLAVAANMRQDREPHRRGIFHLVGSGEASWAEFAEQIFACSESLGGPSARVRPIRTTDYPTAAKRPKNSRLDTQLIEQAHGIRLPNWRDSLRIVVAGLIRSAEPKDHRL